MLLGCIADDFTGATDLASMLVEHGMRTVLLVGLPERQMPVGDTDAVVIALKSRNIPASEAVKQSCAALEWLISKGAAQIFFKYCSTFDSTDEGNIGPVARALLERLGENFTIACPALPVNGRTVYRGHLFVGDALLSESGMEKHPLNPMTDSNLVRVLERQVHEKVGLVPYEVVEQGCEAIGRRFATLRAQGIRFAIVDALCDRHLYAIGAACAELKLVTGGSGVAIGLPSNFVRRGLLKPDCQVNSLGAVEGFSVVLAGSCSRATLAQVDYMRRRGFDSFRLEPLKSSEDELCDAAVRWALPRLGDKPLLIYSSAQPEEVAGVQAYLGRERASRLIERVMARIACKLVDSGVRRLLVAGGETAGTVVQALNVRALQIGRAIDPGVPWTKSLVGPPLFLALKSGNFGSEDFFVKAFEVLK